MTTSVLIVDDDPAIGQMLRVMLSRGDYAVVGEAYNGTDAVRQFDELSPDVVLLDIMMSGPDDGLSTLEKILGKHPQARMVMCSALSNKEVMHQAFKLGAWDYLVKPFTPDQVRAAIDRAVA